MGCSNGRPHSIFPLESVIYDWQESAGISKFELWHSLVGPPAHAINYSPLYPPSLRGEHGTPVPAIMIRVAAKKLFIRKLSRN
jgi:hypothetical protein